MAGKKERIRFLVALQCVLVLAGCQTLGEVGCEGPGTVIGVILGSVFGSQIGEGSGRRVATISGAVLGGVVGNVIGKYLDRNDKCKIGRALDNNEDGRASTWRNEQTGREYTLTPTSTYVSQDGLRCREFVQEVVVDGRREEIPGKACKRPDDTAWDEV